MRKFPLSRVRTMACLAWYVVACAFCLVARAEAPANDSFAHALNLSFEHGTVTGSNVDATREEGEPTLPGDPVGHTVWYSWTAPTNGYLAISRLAGDQSVVFGIYSGASLGHLTIRAQSAHRMGVALDSPDFIWQTRDTLGVSVHAGETYFLAADTHKEGVDPGIFGILHQPIDIFPIHLSPEGELVDTIPVLPPPIPGGTIAFNLDFTSAPSNDAFADAVRLSGLLNTVVATNFAATIEPGEPAYPSQPSGASVWWSWTAPVSGQVVVGLDAPVIYPAASVEVLQSAVDPGGVYGLISHSGDGWSGGGGGFVFIDGPKYTVDLDPIPVFAPFLSVYRGQALASLTSLGRGLSNTFNATAGESYVIAFEGSQGTFGSVTFNVTQTPPPANDQISEALRVLDASRALLNGYTVSTTREMNEPDLGADFAGGSVWYRWIAPTYGSVSLWQTSSPNGVSNPLAVFTKEINGSLRSVASGAYGSLGFFGESGVEYWIGVYRGHSAPGTFQFRLEAPQLRYLDFNLADRIPGMDALGFTGLVGRTALLMVKTADGWAFTESGLIKEGNVVFNTPPQNAIDGKVRLITIDELLPPPRLAVELVDGKRCVMLHGLSGQAGSLSISQDLQSWTSGPAYKLAQPALLLQELEAAGDSTRFYRANPLE